MISCLFFFHLGKHLTSVIQLDSRFMHWPIALQVALPLGYLLESIRIELHGLFNFERVARNLLIGS
jgi:hypothetical protein